MTAYTPTEVLDALIRAGLGDIEQHLITPAEMERALSGEVVRVPRARTGICPRCQEEKENRSWTYCRRCRRERQKQYRQS